MKLSLREAFDLERTTELKLGERTYAVPPLTFGRFQEVLRVDHAAILEALSGLEIADVAASTPAELAMKFSDFPAAAFFDAANAVVPGLRREDWDKSATFFDVADLFFWFAKGAGHDWEFILEALRFGKPPEEGEEDGPTQKQFSAVLLSLSRELGATIADTLGLRIEGFFASVEAIKQRADDAREAEERQTREESEANLATTLPATKLPPGTPTALDAAIAAATQGAPNG